MKTNHPLAVWSLILSIVSIVACGPVTGIPAIICGHMARSSIKSEPDKWSGDGMAIAGLIIGYLGTIVSTLLFIALLIAFLTVPAIIKTIQSMPGMTNTPPADVMMVFFNYY